MFNYLWHACLESGAAFWRKVAACQCIWIKRWYQVILLTFDWVRDDIKWYQVILLTFDWVRDYIKWHQVILLTFDWVRDDIKIPYQNISKRY